MPNGIGSRIKTGSSQTGQLPGRTKSGLRVIEWTLILKWNPRNPILILGGGRFNIRGKRLLGFER